MDPAAQACQHTRFVTADGITVSRTAEPFDPSLLDGVCALADQRRGGVLSSGMEYPGRYSRWHLAYVNPCAEIVASGRRITARALNQRGEVLLPVLGAALRRAGEPVPARDQSAGRDRAVTVVIPEPAGLAAEEDRSRRPTVFSAIREVIAAFAASGQGGRPDPHLGLYGAFGYDLAFQFEPVRLAHARPAGQRDLVLHLPDELYVLDRKRETAVRYRYEFAAGGASTAGLPRETAPAPSSGPAVPAREDTAPSRGELPARPEPGSYARVVAQAREKFARGDLFEVVPSHVFRARCGSPAAFYQRLRQRNPAPYEFFFNLGEGECLVGASPEMYVRVTGERVETCPISGTIRRGRDALEDAENIRALLSSAKDESELTMCTDVDRNDKSRVCVPGSVTVIGRRQIEMYSRLIHTVDHIEGRLRPGLDALDAFLTHMWAVTVTGAPKAWAMQFIEDHEYVPRHWYGGAVGVLGFDGNMNTGLTLRTAHIRGGVAEVRAGATLLFDSDPAAEERETELKARALLETLAGAAGQEADHDSERSPAPAPPAPGAGELPGTGLRVLLVDHQDSFVHTLASYFRQQGAEVTTLRAPLDPAVLDASRPDLVVLSPGPGRPSDFGCEALLAELDARELPVFGVCLGLQAMVEHAGGELALLPEPAHGKPGRVLRTGSPGEPGLLAGLPQEFTAARYHSLHAVPGQVKGGFTVTAATADGVVMAIENAAAGRWAVQFHPESILTAAGRTGHEVIASVLRLCRARAGLAAGARAG
ncbi:MAG: anthranilate synthase component I [Nocardiopsaceae bacterium]|jgi:anthranilate synthase|nr:anthranilate synthase component I [Nocardiopsaceae bacterium]